METGPRLSLSPILSSHSSDNLTDIAARVVQEITAESDHSDFDDGGAGGDFEFSYEGESNYPRIELENHADEPNRNEGGGDGDDDDDDFEFVVAGRDAASSPISADEIFYNGQIRPIYPVFNRNLYFDGFGFVCVGSNCEKPPVPRPPVPRPPPRVRIPLGKLMREDRDPPSCSSSEADELDGIPAEIYCMWKPKTEEEGEEEVSTGKCKKSNSFGSSSKRWKFRNLLHRSNSEGKDMLVFIPTTHNRGKTKVDEKEEKVSKEDEAAETERSGEGGEAAVAAAAEAAVGLRRKATKVGERRASYLPYRKDLVGLFSNLHPFSS